MRRYRNVKLNTDAELEAVLDYEDEIDFGYDEEEEPVEESMLPVGEPVGAME